MSDPRSWTVLSASERGAAHLRDGRPNQDAVNTRRIATAHGPVVVAAVADGHGGERYVRSDVGSRLAVDVATAEVVRVVEGASWSFDDLVTVFPRSIVTVWREQVLAHLAANPFDVSEAQVSGTTDGGDPVIAYGATLLLAVATTSEVLLLQLGDGDITVGTQDDRVLHPVAGDQRLVGGQTTSLCLPDAVGDFRAALIGVHDRPTFVLLSSDGYGNSFADADWSVGVTRDIRASLGRDGAERVDRDLPRWLRDSAKAGGDDVTVAILTRTDAPTPSMAPAPIEAVAPRPRPVNRGLIIAGAVLLSGAGVGVGWLARGDGGSQSVDAAATTSASDTPSTSAPPPSTTVTRSTTTLLATTTVAARAGAVTMAGPAGGRLRFFPDPRDPDVETIDGVASPVFVTRLELDGVLWQIQSGALMARPAGGNSQEIELSDLEPATLMVAGDFVWVVDEAEMKLAAVDPASLAVVGEVQTIVHVSAAGGGPEQDATGGRN